jgi:hypothetical protein
MTAPTGNGLENLAPASRYPLDENAGWVGSLKTTRPPYSVIPPSPTADSADIEVKSKPIDASLALSIETVKKMLTLCWKVLGCHAPAVVR